MKDKEIWLILYQALLSYDSNKTPGGVKHTAELADYALLEYRHRYGKEPDRG